MTCGGTWLHPDDFARLRLLDFPGQSWCEVREYLLDTEPRFLAYLTRDVMARGFEDPAEMAQGELGQGTHRLVVAEILCIPIRLVTTAFHWEYFDAGVRARGREWHDIRKHLFPEEYRAWLAYTDSLMSRACLFGALMAKARYVDRVVYTWDSTGALLFWTGCAVTSIERVLRDDRSFSPWGRVDRLESPMSLVRQQDAALALLALRNTLRAAEWCARDLDQMGENASAFIAAFKDMVPDLVNARDALEHFDDYAAGRGRLQKASPGSYEFEMVLQDGRPAMAVGRFSFDMEHVREACRWLAIRLLARAEVNHPDHSKDEALLDEILSERRTNDGAQSSASASSEKMERSTS